MANDGLKYIVRMRDFHLWLIEKWRNVETGTGFYPTVRQAAKRFRVRQDMIVQMCEDANAHGFDVSVSADDNAGDRIIELL